MRRGRVGVGVAKVVDPHDVRVVQFGEYTRLALEALGEVGGEGRVIEFQRTEHLDGH